MNMKKSTIAAGITAVLGLGTAVLPTAVSAVTLADGIYDMTITNTPYSGGYQIGSDGAWNSSFTFGCLPGTKGCSSNAMYDDTVASPINGKYSGVPNDGVSGTISITVDNGVISTGDGTFEFDMIPATAGGNFVQYGTVGWSGSIDASGNISLTPTGILASIDSPVLVDKAWNIDDFNGGTGTGTNFVPNPPNSNTIYDSFTTGTATASAGDISGAAYDGTSAILVKAGTVGSQWGGFFGASYYEVWNVQFTKTADLPPIPIPAAVWLFGSGLIGLVGVARRKKQPTA